MSQWTPINFPVVFPDLFQFESMNSRGDAAADSPSGHPRQGSPAGSLENLCPGKLT